MKRLLAFILVAALTLSLAACGSGGTNENPIDDSTPQTSSEPENTQPQDSESPSDSSQNTDGQIDVDSGLFNVTITVPATFMDEGVTQEQLTEQAKEAGYKFISLNEDGSATYVMSKAKHQEMMDGIRQSIDESLKQMENSETYPNLASASANSDYTQYIVALNAEEVSAEYAFLPLGFYLFSGMYHAFNGTQPENINIQFVSAATGEVLEEYNSSEME